jgi:outer membrane protein insertion porin family
MKISNKILLFLLFCSAVFAQSRIAEIRFEQNEKFDEATYQSWSGLTRGIPWQPDLIRKANKSIIAELHTRGYLFARIDSVAVRSTEKNDIVLTWYLHEDQLFTIGQIIIQSDSLSKEELEQELDIQSGLIYNESYLAREFQRLNQYHAHRGFPFAEVNLENIMINKSNTEYRLNLDLSVRAGRLVRIGDVIIRGNTVTKDYVIQRETDLRSGDVYRQDIIDEVPDNLYRLGYFKEVRFPKLRILPGGRTAVIIEVVEGNTTTFDGVVGYIPPDQNQNEENGYFTGLIRLNLRNLFGTGRKLEVDWKKPDQFSDEFRIYYEEPWIFGYPVNLGAGLERLVRDTTYIENQVFLNGFVRLDSELKSTFSLYNKSVIPDSTASRDLRLARTHQLTGEIGIDYDTRDNPLNPRKGIRYNTFYSFGLKRNNGPDYLLEEDGLPESEGIQTVRVGLSFFKELWKNQVLALQVMGGKIKGSENRLQLSDHFWFGGSRSLRGYRENQFHGTTVAWLNLEYRFLTGRESRIFIFNDWGFYNFKNGQKTREDILPGYGVGVRFSSPLGVISVDFGLGRGDSFSTGKIHFGIVNQF